RPPNYQLVADELADRFGFERDRKSVAAYARTHFPLLVNAPAPIPKPRRRWQRARVGELWQHDSSIHQWWPASDKQTLLLRVDDHSRKLVERKPLRGGEDGAPAASRFARWRFGFALAFSWDAFRLPTVRRALKHGKPSTFTVSIAAMNIKKAPPMQS